MRGRRNTPRRSCHDVPAGRDSPSTMIVIRIAITPSLNASSRELDIAWSRGYARTRVPLSISGERERKEARMAKYASLVTSKGTIKVRLLPDHAPKTVDNFVGRSEERRVGKECRSGAWQ